MKRLNFTFTRLPLIILLSGLNTFICKLSFCAEEVSPQVQQAEILRTISGTKIGSTGFSAGQIPIQKGGIYVVEKISFSDVDINIDGQLVRVRKADVSISKKIHREPDPVTGFVPGRLVVINAYYGLPTVRPTRSPQTLRIIQNMIPKVEITKPVEVLVTDALFGPQTEIQTATSFTSGGIDCDGNINMITHTQNLKKNLLQVEYQFNGEKLKKSALEESVLILP